MLYLMSCVGITKYTKLCVKFMVDTQCNYCVYWYTYMYCMLWPMFTIWRFSASKTQPTVLWILKVRYCQLRQKVLKTLEQLSCCEKPIFVVLGKVLKELKSNNSLISKLQPLGFLWTLRQMAPGVTEHFIWKHIRVVQEKITLIKNMAEMDVFEMEPTVDNS